MKKALDRMFDEIKRGENLDLYLTILLAVVIALLGIFQVAKFEVLSAVTLAILGLLASSLVVSRWTITEVKSSFDELALASRSLQEKISNLVERPSAIGFFQVSSSLTSLIKNSSSIGLCGLTLTTTLNKEFPNILEKIEQGAKVRILVTDPDSQAIEQTTLRSFDPTNFDYYRNRIKATMQDIEFLHQRWEASKKSNPSRAGSFEVRFLNFAPSFSVHVFNPTESSGQVVVEIYPHKNGFGAPPIFELNPARDGDWYRYFESQFEQMWESAKVWQPKAKSV